MLRDGQDKRRSDWPRVKPTQTMQICRSNRGNAPGTDLLAFLRPQADPGIGRRLATPLPTIADREETQRYHRDGNKDENPNEAKPNQVHVVHMYL